MVWITFSSLSVLVSSAPNPWGKSLENCPEYQYLALHSRPKPCFTPSFHSPRQISSILYSSRMLMPFLSPLLRKSQIFLTGWKRTMLAPLKLIPSPLGCAFWKNPSQQQLSMEQMPQPSQRPSRNCPVQQVVLPQPSYLSSLKQPSQVMLPFAEYSIPKPFLRDRLISPSYTTLLLSMMMLQPSIE